MKKRICDPLRARLIIPTMLPRILIVSGPTASGKSALALEIASSLDGEIINADSVQVYRGMDVGTAKPSHSDRSRIRHHLLDIRNPDQQFTASDFAAEAGKAVADITGRGRCPLIVGGTGLYIRALTRGLIDAPPGDGPVRERLMTEAAVLGRETIYKRLEKVDPVSASKIHPNNLVRVVRALEHFEMTGIPLSSLHSAHGFPGGIYNVLHIAISVDRGVLDRRIDERVDAMVRQGFLNEVRGLLDRGYGRELKAMKSIGYRELCSCVAGEIPIDRAVEEIKTHTRQYARRQITWLKPDPAVHWVAYPENSATILQQAEDFFQKQEKRQCPKPRSIFRINTSTSPARSE